MLEKFEEEKILKLRPVQFAEQITIVTLDDVTPIVEFLEQFRLLFAVSQQNLESASNSKPLPKTENIEV